MRLPLPIKYYRLLTLLPIGNNKFPPQSHWDPQGHHLDNIIYLPGQPGDVLQPVPSLSERGRCFMSTYEEFMIILATASLIVAILNYTYKK